MALSVCLVASPNRPTVIQSIRRLGAAAGISPTMRVAHMQSSPERLSGSHLVLVHIDNAYAGLPATRLELQDIIMLLFLTVDERHDRCLAASHVHSEQVGLGSGERFR